MYLSLKHKGRVKDVLRNWPEKDIRVICATSGGRILGLGDLGANGMGIPIGKLQLYTACAAVPPRHLLPLHIDVGTTNQALINDPLYLGLRQPRVSAGELDQLVEEFVTAVQEVFPGCCIHFEDWAGVDAMRLLARYRDDVCCYNDDIQGTAGGRHGRTAQRASRDGRQAQRSAHSVSWCRLGGHWHCGHDLFRHDAGGVDQRPGEASHFACSM